jgi:hypothetical protein
MFARLGIKWWLSCTILTSFYATSPDGAQFSIVLQIHVELPPMHFEVKKAVRWSAGINFSCRHK